MEQIIHVRVLTVGRTDDDDDDSSNVNGRCNARVTSKQVLHSRPPGQVSLLLTLYQSRERERN